MPGSRRTSLNREGISHVGLRSKNLKKTQEFYKEILGLRTEQPSPGVVYIPVGRDLLVLHDPTRSGSEFHFGLDARTFKEVERWRKMLTARGIPIHQYTVEKFYRSFKIKDPDGHWVEISHRKAKRGRRTNPQQR